MALSSIYTQFAQMEQLLKSECSRTQSIERKAASAPLSHDAVTLPSGEVLDLEKVAKESTQLTPQARVAIAEQHLEQSRANLQEALAGGGAQVKDAERLAKDLTKLRAREAAKQGRPYDQEADFAMEMMKATDRLLGDSQAAVGSCVGSGGRELDNAGKVFHEAAMVVRDKKELLDVKRAAGGGR